MSNPSSKTHWNRYWPLLALPVAAAVAVLPNLPRASQVDTAQTDTAQSDTAMGAQPQTFGTQSGTAENGTGQNDAAQNGLDGLQNDFQNSPFNDPSFGPLAGGTLAYPESLPYAQRSPRSNQGQGSSQNSVQSSAATAALRKVYDAAIAAAVRVNVGSSGIGSGFFMSKDGLILTAAHVPFGDSSAKLSVTTQGGQDLPVTLVGYDEVRDLAVLKASGSDFPALKLAVSSPKVGAGVVAIGNSRGSFDGGRAGSVTALNVSLDASFPSNMIESSMPLAPGDSGGPVLNAAGEVVGVSTAISNQGGQFASYFVPVTRDSALLGQLVSGAKRGVPVLGIGVQGARQTTGVSGVLVTTVDPSLGAAKAGLKGGTVREFRDASGNVQQDISGADIIVGIDGRAVSTPSALISYLRGKQVGDRVTLKVRRGSQTLNLTVTLSAKPTNQG